MSHLKKQTVLTLSCAQYSGHVVYCLTTRCPALIALHYIFLPKLTHFLLPDCALSHIQEPRPTISMIFHQDYINVIRVITLIIIIIPGGFKSYCRLTIGTKLALAEQAFNVLYYQITFFYPTLIQLHCSPLPLKCPRSILFHLPVLVPRRWGVGGGRETNTRI